MTRFVTILNLMVILLNIIPQGYNSVYSTDSAEESERERVRKNQLGRLAKKRFESMLRALSGRRGELARCMAFSLEHAEASSEVADIIIASLLVDGTPVPRKVARLHLICDILHNSAAPLPMAWKFRQEFQSRLGIVFDHLSTIYHSFPGRITAETFKKQITSVIDVWEDWIVFPPEFTAELRARLEGMQKPEQKEASVDRSLRATPEKDSSAAFVNKFKSSSFVPAATTAAAEDDDGEPMDEGSDSDDLDGAPIDDVDGVPVDDVDGEPLMSTTDIDGQPMDDVDGVPMDDLDGAPMDDVDGVPLDDVDGQPMADDIDGTPV
jgi:U2-associated protein SR140